ncbi:MAG: ATP-binding protein [Chloroflexota bacterium]
MTNSILHLNLAPKLNRPLSLWNLLDYGRLLYWAFFFPQALRWYGEQFALKSVAKIPVAFDRNRRVAIQSIWNDPIQRKLLFQAFLLTVIVPGGIGWLLQFLAVEINWWGMLLGIGLAFTLGLVGCMAKEMALGIALEIVLGVLLSITFEFALGLVGNPTPGLMFGIVFGVGGGIAAGVAVNVARSVAGGVSLGSAVDVGLGITMGLAGCVAVSIIGGITMGIAFGITFSLAMITFVTRLPDYIIWQLASIFRRSGTPFSHLTWLPHPGLQAQLTNWLNQDAQKGIASVNDLLAYSMQFIPAIEAVNQWLAQIPNEQILPKVDRLADKPYDWKLLRFNSCSLYARLVQASINGIIFLPRSWRRRLQARVDSSPRLDTTARAACAGYWLLYMGPRVKNAVAESCKAFERVRTLPYGEILYRSVLALMEARQVDALACIVAWGEQTAWLGQVTETPLRPQTIMTLESLRKAALEATVAAESISKLNRSAALGRAVAGLTQLLAAGEETCPELEWPIVQETAIKWREVLAMAAGEAGQIVITRPVANPFVVGNPVAGQVFVGREETFRHLEELWGSDPAQRVPSVVLFGHRRMGKSSILQNLGKHRFGVDTLVAQCTMQRVGKLAHTGELLNYLALAMYDALIENGHNSLAEPKLEDFSQGWYPAFNRFLRSAKRSIASRRMILTLDEFELVEREIAAGHIEPELLEYLRGIIHSEPWLILALAGLHTLEEMTADYWNPLFASVTPVRVSFLSPGASAQLLANPCDDFPLDFTSETAAYVYSLVKGQPYLTQLVGHALVRRYNRLVFEEGKPRDPRFTIEDIDTVVSSPAFYEQGSYYFNGVWEQAEKSGPVGQAAILKTLAAQDETTSIIALFASANLSEADGQDSLKTLIQHDVAQRTTTGEVDFAVPLMRRWIREYKLGK